MGRLIAYADAARRPRGAHDHAEDPLRELRDAHADAGARRALILGADAPTVPRRLVEEAFFRLTSGADAVIVPAHDGGYVLVGASSPVPRLFEGVAWGTPLVAETTRNLARDTGYILAETAPWPDVDVASDLARLADEVAADPERAPATEAFLTTLGLCSPRKPML